MKRVLLGFLIISIGCTKQPEAKFDTDKESYQAGETIICTNQSTDAVFYDWIYFSASTGQETTHEVVGDHEGIEIETLNGHEAGDFTITLNVENEKRNKTDSYSKTVTIEKAVGSASFWTDDELWAGETEITIFGTTDLVEDKVESEPDCQDYGTANIENITVGIHKWIARHKVANWLDSGEVIIFKDECAIVKFR